MVYFLLPNAPPGVPAGLLYNSVCPVRQPRPLYHPCSPPLTHRTGLGSVQGTSTLLTELALGSTGCSQRR
eukprot:534174-Prorocentrum_minimum.AAC.2